jgi:hypothetical protein
MSEAFLLPEAFEPVRRGLKRIIIEVDDDELRDLALSYLEATNQVIGLAAPDGALTDTAISALTVRLDLRAPEITAHAASESWRPFLRVTHALLQRPPGGPTSFPPVPLPPPDPLPEPPKVHKRQQSTR